MGHRTRLPCHQEVSGETSPFTPYHRSTPSWRCSGSPPLPRSLHCSDVPRPFLLSGLCQCYKPTVGKTNMSMAASLRRPFIPISHIPREGGLSGAQTPSQNLCLLTTKVVAAQWFAISQRVSKPRACYPLFSAAVPCLAPLHFWFFLKHYNFPASLLRARPGLQPFSTWLFFPSAR